jgi:GAF domain-containing protein
MTSVATEFVAEFVAQAAEDRPVVEVEPGKSIQGQVLATKIPIVGEDVAEHELASPDSRALAKDFGLHGFAGIPLLANDRSIGVLNVLDKPIRRFTDDEVSLLTAFADQASLALEKARLLSEAEREKAHAETEKERSDALYQVSNRMANAHDTDEVLDLIVNEAARLVGANAAYIRLLDGNALVPSAATKTAAEYVADTAEKTRHSIWMTSQTP